MRRPPERSPPNLPRGWDSEEPSASWRDRLAPGGRAQQNQPVGFNPYRQQRRRRSDYVFVAAAFAVVAVLLLWALLPS